MILILTWCCTHVGSFRSRFLVTWIFRVKIIRRKYDLKAYKKTLFTIFFILFLDKGTDLVKVSNSITNYRCKSDCTMLVATKCSKGHRLAQFDTSNSCRNNSSELCITWDLDCHWLVALSFCFNLSFNNFGLNINISNLCQVNLDDWGWSFLLGLGLFVTLLSHDRFFGIHSKDFLF